jgi:single-strand DNA-binding protein
MTMASGVNNCTFVGNLTRDAEVKMVGENEVASFAIAVNGRKDGEVLFLDCDFWRPGQVSEYLTRGKTVGVSGSLKSRTYEKDGQKRTHVGLQVRELTLLGGARERQEESAF